jgi:hypothetical protein
MFHSLLAVLVFFPVSYSCTISTEPPDRDALAKALEEKGGFLRIDENDPKKPVVGAFLLDARFQDADLLALRDFKTIRQLYLGEGFTDRALVTVKGLTSLQELSASRSRITDSGLNELRNLGNVEILVLNDTRITGAGLKQLKRMTKLKQLALADTGIGDDDLVHLRPFSELEILVLDNSKVRSCS